mmetsp:Transcript_104290/g.301711  ORF Transcript_104290/g.301711 Transcript_104290/m.301711 type:complete len:339 (+) Transcript_104290:1107-2123(+)
MGLVADHQPVVVAGFIGGRILEQDYAGCCHPRVARRRSRILHLDNLAEGHKRMGQGEQGDGERPGGHGAVVVGGRARRRRRSVGGAPFGPPAAVRQGDAHNLGRGQATGAEAAVSTRGHGPVRRDVDSRRGEHLRAREQEVAGLGGDGDARILGHYDGHRRLLALAHFQGRDQGDTSGSPLCGSQQRRPELRHGDDQEADHLVSRRRCHRRALRRRRRHDHGTDLVGHRRVTTGAERHDGRHVADHVHVNSHQLPGGRHRAFGLRRIPRVLHGLWRGLRQGSSDRHNQKIQPPVVGYVPAGVPDYRVHVAHDDHRRPQGASRRHALLLWRQRHARRRW